MGADSKRAFCSFRRRCPAERQSRTCGSRADHARVPTILGLRPASDVVFAADAGAVVSGGLLWKAVLLGILEGITEFVPVSSTGHLILAGHYLAFPEDKAAAFEIFIQLGAVLAVAWFYRRKLLAIAAALPGSDGARALVAKLLVAFVPAAVVGLLCHHWIKERLFASLPVAAALAAGGVALILIDRPRTVAATTDVVDDVSWSQALLIGCVQVLALWPGMSRSGATIIGGLLAGLSRTAALEFSFLLALPTLGAASVFALWDARHALTGADVPVFALGLAVSFVVSLAAIAALLRYVQRNDLRPFGWYRVALAAIIVVSVLA